MFKKFIDSRGTAIVEYVVILAFIAVIGWSFIGSNSMESSITSIFGSTSKMLASANRSNQDLLNGISKLLTDRYLQGDSDKADYSNSSKSIFSIIGDDGKLVKLEEGEYELVIDRVKLAKIAKECGYGKDGKEIEDNFWACVLLYNNENATGKAIYDTGGRKLYATSQTEKNKHDVQHDITAEKTTLTFEVNSSTGEYLGLNIARDSDKFKEVAGRYQDYITLNKIK